MPGFMNLDFADVRTVMDEMGKAMMGTGEAEGENRAIAAAEAAISNPLLDDVSMKGARGVLINITGGADMTLFEVDQAANRIREEVDPDAQIKVGSTMGEGLEGRIRVSVIATGIDANVINSQRSAGAGQVRNATGAIGTGIGEIIQQRVQQNGYAPHPQQAAPAASSSQYFTMPAAVTPQVMAQQPQQQAVQQPVQQQPQQQAAPQQVQQAVPPQMHYRQPADTIPPMPPAYQPRAAAAAQAVHQQQQAIQQAPMQQQVQQQPAIQAPRMETVPVHQPAPAQMASQQAAPHPFDMRVTQLTTPAQRSAADQRRKNRSESLFTRITGFGMVRPSEQQDLADAEMAAEASGQPPRLGVDPSDRPALSSEQSSDLLDIPAFLRRQTNH
jgi:cell division protein FtsZ